MDVVNYLLGYNNIKIFQNPNMFNFSLDSVLLPNFVTLNKKCKRILDIGTGNAVIPLILSTKTKAIIDAVEIQEEVYQLGKKSIELNNLSKQINIMNKDIKNYYKECESDIYDTITCNPPFFKISDLSRKNTSDYKTIARHEVKLNLEEIMMIARKLLKNNGTLAVVHRIDRLVDIFELMKKYNIEPKRLQLVYPKHNDNSNIVLVEGTKNGKPGLKVLEPLITHDNNGEYSNQIKKYFTNLDS